MTDDARTVVRRVGLRFATGMIAANLVGAAVVFVFAILVVPDLGPRRSEPDPLQLNVTTLGVILAVAVPAGYGWSRRVADAGQRWLEIGREPTARERELVLRHPLRQLRIHAALWALAAVAFTAVNAPSSEERAIVFGVVTTLGGLTTCAVGYLLGERILRPVTARALASDPPTAPVLPGIASRIVLSWVLATALPVAGVVAASAAVLGGEELTPRQLALTVLFLSIVALAAGLVAVAVTARSISEPVSRVRRAMVQVQGGDLDVRVQVDDGSEIGLLEAGFNQMAAELGDRARLRDLFGRHVGEEVARDALEREVVLGGAECDVAAMFVDIVGSTRLAATRPPRQVVALLNAFFSDVVDVVSAHGGLVNKFAGDGALCVFGAPVQRPDYADSALSAARRLRGRLLSRHAEIDVAIGVSAGRAVAGHIGSATRVEYTVIGDPVNEAARLCELAKTRPERLLASEAALAAATRERAHWHFEEHVTLRGRLSPTRLATSVDVA